jgi:hypothetical protein
MNRYCFIVAATQTYLPELVANLNSLEYVGNKNDVHLIGIELSDDFLNQLSKLSYNVIHHNITEEQWQADKGKSETVCRKRYWYAAELGKEYSAVCILDADLIWTRNPFQYFVIAEKTGYILGPSKEQNKVYGLDDNHHEFDGGARGGCQMMGMGWHWNVERGFYNDKDLCNCPVFLDAKVWGDALRMSWEVFINGGFKAPDMDAMSLSFLQYGSYDKTVVLPGIQWLGTNEENLKPYIRAIMDHGLMKTECGIPIFSYHGQYYHKKWRDCQLDNRHGCAAKYLKADKSIETIEHMDAQAKGAMNLLYENFMKMLDYKIIIEKINYRHPELPYE